MTDSTRGREIPLASGESTFESRTLHGMKPKGEGRMVTLEKPGMVKLEKGIFLIIRMEPKP